MSGDGESETAPLEGSWKSNGFLNPLEDGAVRPILDLNGYKISGRTVQARAGDDDLKALHVGRGYKPYFVEGDDPLVVQREARKYGFAKQPILPMIVWRTPQGWTCRKEVDGNPIDSTFRANKVPLAGVRENPEHLKILEAWIRSYAPQELSDEQGTFISELAELAPAGNRRMGGNPQLNGGRRLTALDLPDFCDYALEIPGPGEVVASPHSNLFTDSLR